MWLFKPKKSFEMEAKISKIDLTFNDLKVLIFCSTVFFLRMLGTWKKFQTFHKQEWQLYIIVPDLDRICNKYLQLSLFWFSEYESAMSDIEETMSVLSRRSRSTTPTQMMRNMNSLNPAYELVVLNKPLIQDYGSLDRRLTVKGKKPGYLELYIS